MGLITKPPSWGHCTTNLTGSPAVSSLGTAFTSGANNADGTAVALLSNVTHDIEYLVIGFCNHFSAGANSSALADVLVDPAGGTAWGSAALIDDLLVGQSVSVAAATPTAIWYHFPVWLKSGHSVGIQVRTAHTAGITARAIIYAYGGNANPGSWWCGQHVTSVGITAASSQGTDHTAGNSGAYSAWTDLGSTLPAPCGALQFAVQGSNDDTTQGSASYFFEFGVGSTRIGPNISRTTNTTESGWSTPTGPIFCALPSGTQLQVRGTCGGTAEVLDVAAYAVH